MKWQQEPFESFPAPAPYDGPTIREALQDRLGLRLTPKSGTISVVVIDRIERTPVGN